MHKQFMRSAIVLGLLLTTFVAACGSSTTATVASPTKFSLPALRLGLIPLDNATKEIGDNTPFANAISAKLGVPVTLTVGTSYTATITALATGQIDAALFGPFSYILANAKYGVVPIVYAKSSNTMKPVYNSLIITPSDSKIMTLADLKGHTFSFVDAASTSGNLVPQYMLTKAGLDPKTDVIGKFAGSHVASLLAIQSKQEDAGAVASDTYAQQLAKGTFKDGDFRIIATSFDIPQGPIGVSKDMSTSDKKFLADAFTSITDQTILQQAGNAGWLPVLNSQYDGLRDVAKQLGIDVATLVK